MSRRETVELDLDIGKFVGRAKVAEKSVDDIDDQVKELDRDLNKIPAGAGKAAAAMKMLGGDVDGVGGKLQSIGDKSRALTLLDSKIRSSQKEVRKLADEFVRTGDVDVFRRLGEAEGALFKFTGARKSLAAEIKQGLKEGSSEGVKIASSNIQGGFFGAFKSVIDALPAEVKAGLVVVGVQAAALLSPLIGGAIAGAILTGVGAAGLGAAVVLAVRDPAVSSAFKGLGNDILDDLTAMVAPYAKELLGVVDIFRQGWERVGPALAGGVFQPLVRQVQPLADGIVKMIDRAMPGIEAAISEAGPLLAMLAANLPQLGAAIGFFLKAISNDGAVKAFHLILVDAEVFVMMIGQWIGWLTEAYDWVDKIGWRIADWFIDVPKPDGEAIGAELYTVSEAAHETGTGLQFTAAQVKELDAQLNASVSTVDTYAGKMAGKLFDSMMSLDRATLGWEESLTSLKESFKENGKQIDIHTKKGQLNREAILQTAAANMQLYQANIAAGMSAGDAAVIYDQNTDRLRAQMRQAGLTAEQIDGLIGKYGQVPDQVNTSIIMNGLTEAINRLNETLRLAYKLDNTNVTSTATMKFIVTGAVDAFMTGLRAGVHTGTAAAFKYEKGGIRKANSGMLVAPSDPGTILMGEPQTGGEALIPLQGISKSSAMSLMQTVGDGYGLDVTDRMRAYSTTTFLAAQGGGSDWGPMVSELRQLRAEVKRQNAAMSKMQLVLDGQRVGYLQGLSADYQRRGG